MAHDETNVVASLRRDDPEAAVRAAMHRGEPTLAALIALANGRHDLAVEPTVVATLRVKRHSGGNASAIVGDALVCVSRSAERNRP